jgi:hypothetical protein
MLDDLPARLASSQMPQGSLCCSTCQVLFCAKYLGNIDEHIFKVPESVEARGAGEMWRNDHIAKTEKRIVRLARLIVKCIQAETA